MTDENNETPAVDALNPANAEAARYRVRLRETETERDELRGQIDALSARVDASQRRIADSVIAQTVKNPDEFWLVGGSLADYRDEAGDLDTDALTERAREVIAERPHFSARRFQGTVDGGARKASAPEPKPSFASLFNPQN